MENRRDTSNPIVIKQACKYYGSKKNLVLNSLDLTVPKGKIYALLGASGCGKTTLLRCIVGNKRLNSGEILIMGIAHGDKGRVSLGPRIGYMPQENALYTELSIWETMKYFGWIAGLSTTEISARLKVLAEMLLIPNINLRVGILSGGEQRRVSFAVVLLYCPEVLILDEPTVGLDPILRESVWRYLRNLAENEGSTILLTTHYVEESRQAQIVGFMRKGYIVVDAPPEMLLEKFNQEMLDDVFLKLSSLQEDEHENKVIYKSTSDRTHTNCATKNKTINVSSTSYRIKALLWKQFAAMFRNVSLILSTILGSALSVTVFFIIFGHDPINLPIAVTNYETNSTSCDPINCTNPLLSCNYIEILREKKISLRHVASEYEGERLLRHGEVYAYFIIKQNYTSALKDRILNSNSIYSTNDGWNLEYCTIDVYRDFIARDIASYVKKFMTDAFEEIKDSYLASCNVTTKLMKLPIDWKDPVYGRYNEDITITRAPLYLVAISFCMSSIVSSCSILFEKNEGTYNRIFAMGVGHMEILLSHMLTDFCLLTAQTVAILVVMFLGFCIPLEGSLYLTTGLVVANSFCGICFGYAIACMAQKQETVGQILSGNIGLSLLFSGTLWPLEGMHWSLQKFADYLPVTQSARAVLGVLNRGWTVSNPGVYLGLVNVFVWTVIFLAMSIIFLRRQQR